MRCTLCVMLVAVIMSASVWADEADAVKLVEKLGGKITRDDTLAGKPVIGATLDGCEVTDAGLKELKELKRLTSLNLGATKATAAGVKDLQDALPKCRIIPPF